MITYKQLSLAEIFADCQEKFENDKPAFMEFLKQHLDINEFISVSFYNHYYASTGRPLKYPLSAMLWALYNVFFLSLPGVLRGTTECNSVSLFVRFFQ